MARWTGRDGSVEQETARSAGRPKTQQAYSSGDEPDFLSIGKVERKEYDRLKRKALGFEERNYRYVLVIPCDGDQGWCEMGEYSALIYKYKVCLPLGCDVTMHDDLDSFYLQYKIGRVRTRGFDLVRKRLKQAKLYKGEATKDRCVIFELKKVLTEEERVQMLEEERQRQAQMNAIVEVKLSDPVLHQKMVELATRLHRVCYRRMDKLSSATNGQRMVNLCDQMTVKYYKMCAKKKPTVEETVADWEEMRGYAYDLLMELQIVSGLKLWKREICVGLGESVVEIKRRMERHLNYATSRLATNRGRNTQSRVKTLAADGIDGSV